VPWPCSCAHEFRRFGHPRLGQVDRRDGVPKGGEVDAVSSFTIGEAQRSAGREIGNRFDEGTSLSPAASESWNRSVEYGDGFDLDHRAERQRFDSDRGSGRTVISEGLGVRRVHVGVVVDAVEQDGGLDDVVE
jgi:hypothetical protein